MSDPFDVIILGSGFGGTLLGAILCRMGYAVAILDRATHPRFAIGESSTPAADLIFRDLCRRYGLKELLPLTRYGSWKQSFPQLNCGRKRGFSYFHQTPNQPFSTDDENTNQLLVAASSDDLMCDMHWYRPDTDQMFAQFAREQGSQLIEGAEVAGVIREQQRWTISLRDPGSRSLTCRMLVDASGTSQLLLNQLGIAEKTSQLQTRSRAVYTHLERVGRWQDILAEQHASDQHPFDCDAAAQHHLLEEGWLWLLNFDNQVTSVGICFDETAGYRGDHFWDVIRRYPDLARLFADAKLADPPGRWYSTGRMQRLRAAAAGNDWVALPHTVGFVDPLHSTGIALTMHCIERIAAAMVPTVSDAERGLLMADYERELLAAFDWIDQLVWICYQSRRDPDLFHAATMLYFSAVVNYERRRQQGRAGEFLCADWQPVRSAASTMLKELRHQSTSTKERRQLARRLLDLILPLSNVGLGESAAKRMYWHTACDVGGE
jgi:FADH2 O2-dependent halogenase